MTVTALAMAAVPAAALALLYRRDQRRAAAHRRRAFENCRGLLGEAELVQEDGDYPRLEGRYRGLRVELRLVADNINLRKLPVLWLLVSVRCPLAVTGVLDVILRPQNTEYFSPAHRLPDRLPTPAHWPGQAVLKGREPAAMRSIAARLEPHLAHFGHEDAFKELLVGPGGLRLGWMADQAERGAYLAMRQAAFRQDVLDRHMVETALRRAVAIAEDLREAAS